MLAQYLYDLSDESPLWAKMEEGYNKQFCFRDISFNEIMSDRIKAKEWFNSQLQYWGSNACKVIDSMMKEHEKEKQQFLAQFEEIKNKFVY